MSVGKADAGALRSTTLLGSLAMQVPLKLCNACYTRATSNSLTVYATTTTTTIIHSNGNNSRTSVGLKARRATNFQATGATPKSTTPPTTLRQSTKAVEEKQQQQRQQHQQQQQWHKHTSKLM